MIRGLYTAASGMIAQSRRQEMLSNNLNNIETPGYKADQEKLRTFPEMLIRRLGGDQPDPALVGDLATGVYMDETIPDFSQGTITQTDRDTDVALAASRLPINPQTGSQEGALLFNVRTPDGDLRYTRNGHFTLSPTGQLSDADGNLVLDTENAPIQLPSDQFQITANGTIVVDGAAAAQLGVSYAADTGQLVKEGGYLFRLEGGGTLPPATGIPDVAYELKQGFLEGSNVSADEAVTEMMESYRTFEANQKVLQMLNSSLDKTVNQVGRING